MPGALGGSGGNLVAAGGGSRFIAVASPAAVGLRTRRDVVAGLAGRGSRLAARRDSVCHERTGSLSGNVCAGRGVDPLVRVTGCPRDAVYI